MCSNIGWFKNLNSQYWKTLKNKNFRVNNYGVGMAAILVSKIWRSWRVNKVSSMQACR